MSMQFSQLNLELDFPQSIGVYDKYEEAQKRVDFLADEKFPVENLAIVGTDLRLVERVTGRKDWNSVMTRSALSGVSTGLLVGVLLGLFAQPGQFWLVLLTAVLISILLNLIFGALSYKATGGKRDFNSVAQTVPTKFEILCEHKVATQAKEKLATMPGGRAQLFE